MSLPGDQWGKRWQVVLDTATSEVGKPDAETFDASTKVELPDHAIVLLEYVNPEAQ